MKTRITAKQINEVNYAIAYVNDIQKKINALKREIQLIQQGHIEATISSTSFDAICRQIINDAELMQKDCSNVFKK